MKKALIGGLAGLGLITTVVAQAAPAGAPMAAPAASVMGGTDAGEVQATGLFANWSAEAIALALAAGTLVIVGGALAFSEKSGVSS